MHPDIPGILAYHGLMFAGGVWATVAGFKQQPSTDLTNPYRTKEADVRSLRWVGPGLIIVSIILALNKIAALE